MLPTFGMSALAAAALLTIIGLIGIIGRAGLGFIGDKLHNNVTLAIGFILVAVVFFCNYNQRHRADAVYLCSYVRPFFRGRFTAGVDQCRTLRAAVFRRDYGRDYFSAIISAGRWDPSWPDIFTTRTAITGWPFLLCGVAGIAAGIVIWLVKPAAKQRN